MTLSSMKKDFFDVRADAMRRSALRPIAAISGVMLHFAAVFADVAEQPSDQLDLLWPTPLLKLIDPIAQSANSALKRYILQMARMEPGVQKTNLGGWQSEVDFFERDDPAVALLRTRAYHAVFRYLQAMAPPGSAGKYEVSIGSAWANINNRTQGNSPHLHPGVQVSAVYYVDDGGSRDGGVRLVDPRPQASMVPTPARWTHGTGEHIRVSAMPGLFVIFPSWLQHYVVAHEGKAPRISVSFNVRLTFPVEVGADATFVTSTVGASGSSSSMAAPPPKLSFTVPTHHQKEFLNSKNAKHMLVS
jgi:uncharacterized protein (TIGR02466 family)